jgi:hypothetical protein
MPCAAYRAHWPCAVSCARSFAWHGGSEGRPGSWWRQRNHPLRVAVLDLPLHDPALQPLGCAAIRRSGGPARFDGRAPRIRRSRCDDPITCESTPTTRRDDHAIAALHNGVSARGGAERMGPVLLSPVDEQRYLSAPPAALCLRMQHSLAGKKLWSVWAHARCGEEEALRAIG